MAEPPKTPSFIQRRKYFRLPLSLPVEAFDSQGKKYLLTTRDLSAGGMNLVAAGAFPINSRLNLRFALDNPKDPLSLSGTVRWIRPDAAHGKWSMGIQFENAGEAIQEKIQKFLNAKALEFRRRGLM